MKSLTGVIDLFSQKLEFLLTDNDTKEELETISISGNNIEKDLYEAIVKNNVSNINLIGGPIQYTEKIQSNLKKMLKTNNLFSNVTVKVFSLKGIDLSNNK